MLHPNTEKTQNTNHIRPTLSANTFALSDEMKYPPRVGVFVTALCLCQLLQLGTLEVSAAHQSSLWIQICSSRVQVGQAGFTLMAKSLEINDGLGDEDVSGNVFLNYLS